MIDPTMSYSAMEPDEDDKKKKKKGKQKGSAQKSQGESAGEGAASGAATGTAIAPGVGTLVGAGIGAAAGAVDSNQQKQAAGKARNDANPYTRRRLGRGIDKFNETKNKRERALATLSQAVFDWAASIR